MQQHEVTGFDSKDSEMRTVSSFYVDYLMSSQWPCMYALTAINLYRGIYTGRQVAMSIES